MYVWEIGRVEREGDVTEGRQRSGAIGRELTHGVLAVRNYRPTVVHILLFFSHGGNCAMTAAHIIYWMSPDQPISLADDLAARSDELLLDLLQARPDLASPPPPGVAVLAQRALSAASINRCGEDLDVLSVAVLETLGALRRASGGGAVTAAAITEALSERADTAAIGARIDSLAALALIWGPADALQTGPHMPAAWPWRSALATAPINLLDLASIREKIDRLGERERDLLTTLSTGPGLGRTRDAALGPDSNRPVPQLIAQNMLVVVDDQTVELPVVIGQLLRDEEPAEPTPLRPPELTGAGGRKIGLGEVDAAAAGEALEFLRHSTDALEALGAQPATVLRAGGMGVREIRRLTKVVSVDEKRMGLVLEVLSGLRLIDSGFPVPDISDGLEPSWAPTTSADSWIHQSSERRWFSIASAWIDLHRRPWQIGDRTPEGTIIGALVGSIPEGAARAERMLVLQALAEAKPGAAVTPTSLGRQIAWRHPRWIRRLSQATIAETLSEAQALGLVAHGALTSAGREIVAAGSAEDVETHTLAAMARSIPAPIDFFLAQADQTITAPGPLTPELTADLSLVADLESGGAASVYRVSEASVRRALDAGRTGTELLAFFTSHSKTPVPQSISYLIDDVARKHGQLRVGVASSFIRCEDPTTLAAVLSSPVAESLSLRALAPTVAVTSETLIDVLDQLRAAGFAPAGEDATGELVDLRFRGARLPTPRERQSARKPSLSLPSRERLGAVLTHMRSQDAANSATLVGPGKGGSSVTGGGLPATALLQKALNSKSTVRLGYVNAEGFASRHVVVPRLIGAGQVIAVEPGGDDEHRFSLHRITTVEMVD